MDKAHSVQDVMVSGDTLALCVDGKTHKINIADHSERLAEATQGQRENFEVSPTGYGIHWSDIDEDLSIDSLIGTRHPCPLAETVG
jgi:Protein of unknown function (DUF2442)